MRNLSLGLGIPVAVLAVSFIVFYFALGRDVTFEWGFWQPIVLFLVVFGAIILLAKFASDKLLSKSNAEGDKWEHIRLDGKWKYVLSLFAQISSAVIVSLLFGFFVTDRTGNEGTTLPLISFGILALLVLVGSFVFSMQLWKSKEYEFQHRRSLEEQDDRHITAGGAYLPQEQSTTPIFHEREPPVDSSRVRTEFQVRQEFAERREAGQDKSIAG